MITMLLAYPDNIDICSHGLPLPANVSTTELMALTFHDDKEYWSYLNRICEIIDDLEHSRFFSHKQANVDKLGFCKVLLKRLVAIKLTVYKQIIL